MKVCLSNLFFPNESWYKKVADLPTNLSLLDDVGTEEMSQLLDELSKTSIREYIQIAFAKQLVRVTNWWSYRLDRQVVDLLLIRMTQYDMYNREYRMSSDVHEQIVRCVLRDKDHGETR